MCRPVYMAIRRLSLEYFARHKTGDSFVYYTHFSSEAAVMLDKFVDGDNGVLMLIKVRSPYRLYDASAPLRGLTRAQFERLYPRYSLIPIWLPTFGSGGVVDELKDQKVHVIAEWARDYYYPLWAYQDHMQELERLANNCQAL